MLEMDKNREFRKTFQPIDNENLYLDKGKKNKIGKKYN